MRLVMEQDQRPADLRVPQGCQPSGFGGINIFIQIGADSLHEQNVGQPCDNRGGAIAARPQFFKDLVHCHSEHRGNVSASPIDMDERRKNRKKRVGRAILRLHFATHQSRDRSRAPCAKRPLFVPNASLEKVEKINNLSCWRIPYNVQATSRYDYEIIGRQLYRLGHSLDFDPALSLRNDVKSRPSVIDAEAPWRAKFGPVVGAASKTDRTQKVVDQCFAPSVSGDIHRAVTLHVSTQSGNVIVLYLAAFGAATRSRSLDLLGRREIVSSASGRGCDPGPAPLTKRAPFASRHSMYRGFGFGVVSASNVTYEPKRIQHEN